MKTMVLLLGVLQVSDIVKVLSLSGSSYLAPFLQLKERIQQEAVAAEDNVRFLACLEGPCQQLSKATPQQIPALLPQVLNCIRMVWSLSRYYNTPERIVSLLQKLSNEIINRCCSALKVEDILTGNVLGVMEMLQQSMAAGALPLLEWHAHVRLEQPCRCLCTRAEVRQACRNHPGRQLLLARLEGVNC